MNSEKMLSNQKEDQLLKLIQNYKGNEGSTGQLFSLSVEPFGVIVEYVGSSPGYNLENVLTINPTLANLFSKGNDKKNRKANGLLDSLIRTDEEFRSLLKFSGQKHFLDLRRMLLERKPRRNLAHRSPDDLVKFEVHSVIWQLSDIHFGTYYADESVPPETLANRLGLIVSQYPDYAPHLVVISGDITSTASAEEFDQFNTFAKKLSSELWGTNKPHRFLIVPGNHDTLWHEAGSTDKMRQFRESLEREGFITPFSNPTNLDDKSGVVVNSYPLSNSPPIVEISIDDLQLRVLLLNSAYYSGELSDDVRQKMKEALGKPDNQTKFIDAIREDKGEFSEDYVNLALRKILASDQTGIAVTHHHLCQRGLTINANPQADRLLTVLANKGIRLILHGHTHLFEEQGSANRKPDSDKAYPIPCSTLSGYADLSSRLGFCVHCLGSPGPIRHFATLNWPINSDRQFDPKSIACHHKFKISKAGIEPLDL